MRKLLPIAGAFLTIFAATQSLPARAQDAGAFADVPTSSWAYKAAAELQRQSVVTGWPADYFSGKRTLTRYEFAIALKRALDKLEYSGPGISEDAGSPGVQTSSTEPQITLALLARVRDLVDYFKADLINLHANLAEVNERLTQLGRRVNANDARPNGMPPILRPDRSINTKLEATSGAQGFDLLRGYSRGDFAFLQATAIPRPYSDSFSRLQFGLPIVDRHDSLLGQTGSSLLGNSIGRSGGSNTDLHLDLPLTPRSAVDVSLRDTLITDDLLSSNLYRSTSFGTSISMHPLNRFSVDAEARRNITELIGQNGSPISLLDNNTYLLNVGYKSGPASAVLGYRVVAPSSNAAGAWNGNLLGITSINNGQGPFTRIAFQFSNRLQSYVGGDYYANTGVPSSIIDPNFAAGLNLNPALLTGNIYRGTAGIRWSPTRRISLTADYEGILYDISGAGAVAGRRSPVEQYITLGAGLNLTRNAILKLAYQIYNQQDSSGSSDGSLGQNGGNTSVFTTQLAIHF